MHPAFSVIFLTTLIGVGQGLFLALYTGEDFKKECLKLLMEFEDTVSRDKYDLGRTSAMPHQIRMDTNVPIHVKQFRIP